MYHKRCSGLSLIELLISIAIVAALSGVAYMAYSGYISGSKKTVARTTMRKLVEAVQAYNSDHARPYCTSTLRNLLGPYLSEIPQDPWEQDYIVDYFFGRIVTKGPNVELETFVPYHPFYRLVRTDPSADDLRMEYQHLGLIACQSDPALMVMQADGNRPSEYVSSNVRAVAGAANCSLLLYTDGSNDVHLIELAEGSIDESVLTLHPGIGKLDGSSLKQLAWSPDCIRYAYVCTYNTASAVMIGATTDSIEPFVACTVPNTERILDVTFSGDGRRLYMTRHGAASDSLYVAAAAKNSTVTTHVTMPGNPTLMHVSASRDGRFLAVSDSDTVHILRTSTRNPLVDIYGNPITFGGGSDPAATWPSFSPDSKKVAYVSGGDQIWAASLLVSSYDPVRLDDFSAGGAVSHVSWD